MDITQVKTALVNGFRCRRTSWKEDVKFIFMQVPAEIDKDIVKNIYLKKSFRFKYVKAF